MNKSTLMSLLESGYELRDSSVLMEGGVADARHAPVAADRQLMNVKQPLKMRARQAAHKIHDAFRSTRNRRVAGKALAGVGALAAGIGIGKHVISRHTPAPHPASAHIANAKAFMGKHGGKVALAGGALAGLSLLRRKKGKKNRR